MNKTHPYRQFLEPLLSSLRKIEEEEDDHTSRAIASISTIKKSIQEIKNYFSEHEFKTEEEEIYFFKHIKPEFFSRLIFYIEAHSFETRLPFADIEVQQKFVRQELKKVSAFFDYNLEFRQYIQQGYTHFDDKYFLRGKEDLRLISDSCFYYNDPDFSTSHDMTLSKIIGWERYSTYLLNRKNELEQEKPKSSPSWVSHNRYEWTASKTSLVELIYALHASKSVNNGSIPIKELTFIFEQLFNTNLGDIYRVLLDIRLRHNPTKYLDELKTSFMQRLNEEK